MELGPELPMDVEDYDTEGVPDFLYWRGFGVKRGLGFRRPILDLCLHSKLTVFTQIVWHRS